LAPKDGELDVTPIAMQPEESTRMLIDIKFQNRKTYLAFQEEFLTTIKNYYKNKIDDMDINDNMANNRIRISEKFVKKSDSYVVDTTPNFKNLKSANDESTPSYRKSFGKTISGDKEQDEIALRKSATSTPRNNSICFNCDKNDHQLRDCPEPRNGKKISRARLEFTKKNELRYHDEENEFSQMVPGTISDDLRTALGINEHEIPLYVYRMRLFGYPPAWFEEAKVPSSGLSMFVEKNMKQLESDDEEGAAETEKFKYDVQKIFDYPGFNVPVPSRKFRDLSRDLNVPPMLYENSKEKMIEALGADCVVNGYKKRRLRDSGAIVSTDNSGGGDATPKTPNVTNTNEADMEIDDEDEATMPTGVSFSIPSNPSESRKSPDVDELENKRKKLLAEIANSSAFLDTSTIDTSVETINDSVVEPKSPDSLIVLDSSVQSVDDEVSSSDLNITVKEVDCEAAPISSGHVQETVYGAPVLPSFSKIHTLPKGEAFGQGVSEVIAFENLAESTGKFEKMKTLIDKVRVFQKQHHKD